MELSKSRTFYSPRDGTDRIELGRNAMSKNERKMPRKHATKFNFHFQGSKQQRDCLKTPGKHPNFLSTLPDGRSRLNSRTVNGHSSGESFKDKLGVTLTSPLKIAPVKLVRSGQGKTVTPPRADTPHAPRLHRRLRAGR